MEVSFSEVNDWNTYCHIRYDGKIAGNCVLGDKNTLGEMVYCECDTFFTEATCSKGVECFQYVISKYCKFRV